MKLPIRLRNTKMLSLSQNTFRLIADQERLEITLSTSVPRTGSYDDDLFVTIEFNGSMENRIVGLYKSTYLNEEQQPRWDILFTVVIYEVDKF